MVAGGRGRSLEFVGGSWWPAEGPKTATALGKGKQGVGGLLRPPWGLLVANSSGRGDGGSRRGEVVGWKPAGCYWFVQPENTGSRGL